MTFLTGLSVLIREILKNNVHFLLRRSVYWMRRFALYFTPAIPTSHVRLQYSLLNSLRSRQNGPHFADDIFKCIFLNTNVWIPIKISLKFVPKGPINNIPALVQIMAWRRPGNRPLSEPMLVSLSTHICSLGLNELIDIQLLAVWGETPPGKTRHATSEWDDGYVMCKIGLVFHCFA